MGIRKFFLLPFAGVALAAAFAACAASDTSAVATSMTGESVCVSGHQTSCACFGGVEGVQTCRDDGSGFDECDCSPPEGTTSSSSGEPPPPCGNSVCATDENCHTCEVDCGVCEPCTQAPKCDNAFVPDPNPMHFPQLDISKMTRLTRDQIQARLELALKNAGPEVRLLAAALDGTAQPNEHPLVGALRSAFGEHAKLADVVRKQLAAVGKVPLPTYRTKFPFTPPKLPAAPLGDADPPPGGTVACGAPQLRIGVSKIKVYEKDDLTGGDEIYCVIQAEAAAGGELRLLPLTPSTSNGKEFNYSLESGVIWGQKGPKIPLGNLQITYDCIEQDSSDGYQNLINSIGKAASAIGGVIPGDSGWIFTVVGAIAPVLSGALGLNGDDHLFNAQQIIPLDMQLQMTNGVSWSVRRGDDGNFIDNGWDWELSVQAWGCTEYGTL